MEIIIAAILGVAGGFGLAWLIIRKLPQEKIREINYAQLQKEQEMAQKYANETRAQQEEFLQQKKLFDTELLSHHEKLDAIKLQLQAMETKRDTIQNDIKHLEQSKVDAEIAAQIFLDQQMQLATEHLDKAVEAAAQKCQDDILAYNEVYQEAVEEAVSGMQDRIVLMGQQAEILTLRLADLQNAVTVAVEAAKRQEEMRQQQNFYRLIIPESDMREIAQLRAVEPYLRDKEALNKVIWKVYYEKPYTDMVGRVVGSNVKTGIYKITNIENEMCYIGQAVNIADRWKQHIKRGLGAETPTRNKLYPAMAAFGVENFTFEIVEECPKDKLDAQEDYWQDFFKAKEFGYSIK